MVTSIDYTLNIFSLRLNKFLILANISISILDSL